MVSWPTLKLVQPKLSVRISFGTNVPTVLYTCVADVDNDGVLVTPSLKSHTTLATDEIVAAKCVVTGLQPEIGAYVNAPE
jgi:hypothetical protein